MEGLARGFGSRRLPLPLSRHEAALPTPHHSGPGSEAGRKLGLQLTDSPGRGLAGSRVRAG